MDELYKKLQVHLPKLPGYIHDLKVLPNQRKSHIFDLNEDVSICKSNVPGIGGVFTQEQLKACVESSVSIVYQGKHEEVPAWVAFDRQVLRFFAYFQEGVEESREEKFRIRKVSIYLYLEDDSIHVIEPKVNDSGIPHGTLIRRHQIENPFAVNKQHFIMTDLNVDKEITFYGKTFKIVGCDNFTREFLTSKGINVPDNSHYPVDEHTVIREELLSRMKPTRPYKNPMRLRQFLDNDRKVLRFHCIWDDTSSKFGDVHKMEIHYFLSNDTIEIRELVSQGTRKDRNQVFLGRCKLPKRVFEPSTSQTRPAVIEYYTDKDFMIGTIVHLFRRPFMIYDCDEFTKLYYKEHYGLGEFLPESQHHKASVQII